MSDQYPPPLEGGIAPLVQWFKFHKRDLPWRNNPSPYAVWISEVMLQQTQVAVVIPYYLRWMELFPTIQALACTPLEDVIKCWEGLGYYSRARNLHQGAQYVLEKHGGDLPQTTEELLQIKGLGEYTVGAILSFAFHQKEIAVDGNVQRVVSRLFALKEDLSKSKGKKTLHTLAKGLLPDREPWIVSEALIELGAVICTKLPRCYKCPLVNVCNAFLEGKADKIPYKSKKIKIEKIRRGVAVIESRELYLLRKVPAGEIMEGLYEFPYFADEDNASSIAAVLAAQFGLQVHFKDNLNRVEQGFTRFQAILSPFIYSADETKPIAGFHWIEKKALKNLPFSSGHRKIFHALNATFVDD